MHGLILRLMQSFLADTYGQEVWLDIAYGAGFDVPEFEAMLSYDPKLVDTLLDTAKMRLGKPREAILEDMGTYLVSHPNTETLRRLLRFGGVDFIEFLHSLDDLPGRARLAVPDLDLPDLELREFTPSRFCLQTTGDLPGFGHVMLGLMRAMADDYGTLVILDHAGQNGRAEVIDISVVETEYSEGRHFALGAGAALATDKAASS